MAIIEGLQAAWGTISRIIAAFGAFMAFLQAVQSGAAGPLFATALAAAAIVLLDFVSNWLLKKLAGPAKKVGARLKGMGDKLKNKLKGKGPKGAKGKPKAHAKPTRKKDGDGPDGPRTKGKPGSTKKKPADKSKDPKKKDPKKDKDERARVQVQRAAQRAARDAWARARGRASRQVVTRGELDSILNSAESRSGGIAVKVDIQQAGQSWSIRANAHKGAHRATATAGRGAALRSKRGGGVHFVAKDVTPLERRVAARVKSTLHATPDSADTTSEIEHRASSVRAEGQRALDAEVRGLHLSLDVAREGDGDFRVKGLIDPNYWEWEIELDAGAELDAIRKKIAAHSGVGRLNELLSFFKRLAEVHKVKFDIDHSTPFVFNDPSDKSKGGRKLGMYVITYSHGGKSLQVTMKQKTEHPGTDALSGRPLGGAHGTSQSDPHDAIAHSTWKTAFEDVAGTMGVSTADPAYNDMIGFTSTMGGKSQAVADGKSNQPFDGTIHADRSAAQRHDDTAGMATTDLWTTHPDPTIGNVDVGEYRGRDWEGMNRDEVLAGMRVRVMLVIKSIQTLFGSPSFQRKLSQPRAMGGFGTVADAEDFLDKVGRRVMHLATK
jgi:hypothetical protein